MLENIKQFILFIWTIVTKSEKEIRVENLALRQQLANLRMKRKPVIKNLDRMFWVILQSFWKNWKSSLIIVQPETVVEWHREGFRIFWKYKCRYSSGRPKKPKELREIIKRMSSENPWGAPRIHGELIKLGFDICESTVSNYLKTLGPRKPTSVSNQTWKTFLHNHLHNTVSMDFVVIPTVNFSLLYCLVIINHRRREILHFNVTSSPNVEWINSNSERPFHSTTITNTSLEIMTKNLTKK